MGKITDFKTEYNWSFQKTKEFCEKFPNLFHVENQTYDFDVLSLDGERIEIKWDRKAVSTGNIFVEFLDEVEGKPLERKWKFDFLFYFLINKNEEIVRAWKIPVDIIEKIVKNKFFKKVSHDSYRGSRRCRAWGRLVPTGHRILRDYKIDLQNFAATL